jgi:hypothetical protein
MPNPLIHYWTMWNEPDIALVRSHLDRAVSPDVATPDTPTPAGTRWKRT